MGPVCCSNSLFAVIASQITQSAGHCRRWLAADRVKLMSAGGRSQPVRGRFGLLPAFRLLLWLAFLNLGITAQAALQFDVFLGYDGIVPEASWFPVVCEIKNDGPTFTATVELSGGAFNQGQATRTVVELPTGTLKRLTLPVFASSRGYTTWDARLLDERGKVRAEQLNLRARKQVSRSTPILGALSRTASGTPPIRQVRASASELQPAAARLLPPIFPDNPLVLEGLACIYLNSERAADLNPRQVDALFGWLNAGGHLVIGLEQPQDVSSSPWLKVLFPCDVKELKNLDQHPELHNWVTSATWRTNANYRTQQANYPRPRRSGLPQPAPVQATDVESVGSDPFKELPVDLTFEAAPMQIAAGRIREGTAILTTPDNVPLIVSAPHGRGRVTALLFSPEREPVRSWKNLDLFWAKMAGVPGALYLSKDFNVAGGFSSDGIFGAMIDTRQVHKLPVGWLLLLLIVYLVVIGPLDQFWLKRIGKPMLTWITFPCYVVVFSLVIYLIGYKLRAGESEWNELHVVDVLRNGERTEMRGRTYSSVYSPANQRYQLASQQKCATLRGEFLGLWGGGQATEKANVLQTGDTFKADIFVPVWTSELYVSDWWHAAPSSPLDATVTPQANGWQVRVDNHTETRLSNVVMVVQEKIFTLGEVASGESKTFAVKPEQGRPLRQYVWDYGAVFQDKVQSRQRAMGSTESGQLEDLPNHSIAASFLSQLPRQQNYGGYDSAFISPPGLDLWPVVESGGSVVLAWASDYSPVKALRQFTPRRSSRYTLWRVSIPAQ